MAKTVRHASPHFCILNLELLAEISSPDWDEKDWESTPLPQEAAHLYVPEGYDLVNLHETPAIARREHVNGDRYMHAERAN